MCLHIHSVLCNIYSLPLNKAFLYYVTYLERALSEFNYNIIVIIVVLQFYSPEGTAKPLQCSPVWWRMVNVIIVSNIRILRDDKCSVPDSLDTNCP